MSTRCSTPGFLLVHSPGYRAVCNRLHATEAVSRRGGGLFCQHPASLGIFLSPLLVGLVMNVHGAGGSLEQVGKIMLQLPLPFVLGHLLGRGLRLGVAQ